MKAVIGPIEIGWVIGPWIKVGRYEIGIGEYTARKMDAIVYKDFDGVERIVRWPGEPVALQRRVGYLGRRESVDGETYWTLYAGNRTLYLARQDLTPRH